MSEDLQSFPAATLPPTSAHRLSTVICWVLIVASVGFVAWRVYLQKSWMTDTGNDFQMELNARMLVGHKTMFSGLDPSATDAAGSMRTIDKTATTTTERVRAAIAAGEIGGKDEALKRLKSLKSTATTQPLSGDLQTLEQIYRGNRQSLTPEQRDALIARHEWFGQLALSHGLPDDDPERAAVLDKAYTAFKTAMFAFFGLVGLGLAGFVLLIVAIVLLAIGKLRPMFSPIVSPSGAPVFLEAFAIYITIFCLCLGPITRLAGVPPFVVYMCSTLLIPIVIAWPVVRGGLRLNESMLGFGWHRGRGIFTEMGCGIGAYIAGLPLLAIAILITVMLAKISGGSPSHPITDDLRESRAVVVAIFVMACIWAPLMEETMFRGALFNHLRGRWSWIVSSLIVGLLFALVHPQGWTAIPALGAIGAILASIREWRGSLIGPITAHAMNNATVLTISLLLVR